MDTEVLELKYNPIILHNKQYFPIPYLTGMGIFVNDEDIQVMYFDGIQFVRLINIKDLIERPKIPCLFIPVWELTKFNDYLEKQSIPKIYDVIIYNHQYFFTECGNRVYQSKNPEFV